MKKSFLRGFFAGVLTYFLMVLIFAIFAFLFKKFIWSIISGVPYVSTDEPIVVGSSEWYLLQPLAFLSAFLSGIATARWSKTNSFSALLLVLLVTVGVTISSPIDTDSILNLAIWNLEVPVGLIFGFYFFNKRSQK